MPSFVVSCLFYLSCIGAVASLFALFFLLNRHLWLKDRDLPHWAQRVILPKTHWHRGLPENHLLNTFLHKNMDINTKSQLLAREINESIKKYCNEYKKSISPFFTMSDTSKELNTFATDL